MIGDRIVIWLHDKTSAGGSRKFPCSSNERSLKILRERGGGGGGRLKSQNFLKESMKPNLNFQCGRVGKGYIKNLPQGRYGYLLLVTPTSHFPFPLSRSSLP